MRLLVTYCVIVYFVIDTLFTLKNNVFYRSKITWDEPTDGPTDGPTSYRDTTAHLKRRQKQQQKQQQQQQLVYKKNAVRE